jgi:hypothetical protein
MKIAVIVYGQVRLFDITVKSWDFKNHYDCDFYFSTWDKTEMESGNLGIKYEEFVDENVIRKHIPDAKIHILKESDFFDSTYPANIPYTKTMKTVFHMKNALRMIRESGIHYDMIILMRPDQYLTFYTSFTVLENFCEKNKIYGLSKLYLMGPPDPFVIDTFFCGGFDEISHLVRTLPNTLEGMHKELGVHILNTNLELVDCNTLLNNTSVRPNCRDLKDDEINHNNIAQKMIEWGANY